MNVVREWLCAHVECMKFMDEQFENFAESDIHNLGMSIM